MEDPGTPLAGELAGQLRAEVRRLKTLSGRTRKVAPLLHVGTPGGARLVLPLAAVVPGGPDDLVDPGLAGDVLTRALDRMVPASGQTSTPHVWLTRAGTLVPGDHDWRWRSGTTVARARRGVGAGRFFVVTRVGWLELPSGETRTWSRMRPTWEPPYADDRDAVDRPDPLEGWPVRF